MSEEQSLPRVGLIWAEAHGGAIGQNGEMPWHLPEDLAHFKRTTMNAPVIMGRRTWESLPERVRPLPGRRNVVVTRDRTRSFEGAHTADSLTAALELVADAQRVWVMGGGELYRAAMPFADELVVTRIEFDAPGADTFAPAIGEGWRRAEAENPEVSSTGLRFSIERWERLR